MGAYFTDSVQASFNKIFHQCNKAVAWEGKAELDKLIEDDQNGITVPGIEDVYAVLARVYSGPQFTWVEAGFPEDDPLSYKYLHEAIRRGSAIGILQAMRTSGALTPTIEKQMPMTKDEAFQKVLAGAEQGCSYCAYAIGNVYFWHDFVVLETARKTLPPPPKRGFGSILKSLFVQQQEVQDTRASKLAEYWFRQSADNGLVIAYRNLRNVYFDLEDYDKATETVMQGAEAGLPLMIYLAGDTCRMNDNHQEALKWFEKGVAYDNGMCLRDAAEYYAKPYLSDNIIPRDIDKALAYYERAAVNPDRLDFEDHEYCTVQAIIIRTLNIGGDSQDWPRITHLMQSPYVDAKLDALWPYIAYAYAFNKSVISKRDTVLHVCKEALRCHDEFGSYDYADHLWQLAVGYAYETGLFTESPDLDTAVMYYTAAKQSIDRHNIENKDKVFVYGPFTLPDEASERLEAFEEVNGHYQYRPGITQSSTTYSLMPTGWPHSSVDLFKTYEGLDRGWRTCRYTLEDVRHEWEQFRYINLGINTNRPAVDGYLDSVYTLVLLNSYDDERLARIEVYGFGRNTTPEGASDDAVYEVRYVKDVSEADGLRMIEAFYNNGTLPAVDDTWHKEYRNTDNGPAPYVLIVDNDIFRLDQFEDAHQMIKDSLEGLVNGSYEVVGVRPENTIGIAYYVAKDKKTGDFHVRLYLKETNGTTYGFERIHNSLTSINFWIQDAINNNNIPQLDDWSEIKG